MKYQLVLEISRSEKAPVAGLSTPNVRTVLRARHEPLSSYYMTTHLYKIHNVFYS